MFNAKTLKELEALYVKDQDDIAKKREQGLFLSKEADIAAQKESWESYIVERYNLSGELKDKKVIVNYYGNISILSYSDKRDDYYSGAGTIVESDTLKKGVLEEFEAKLILAGVLDKQTTTVFKESFLTQLKEVEDEVKTEKTEVTESEFATLCKDQMPIATTYIQGFKK